MEYWLNSISNIRYSTLINTDILWLGTKEYDLNLKV